MIRFFKSTFKIHKSVDRYYIIVTTWFGRCRFLKPHDALPGSLPFKKVKTDETGDYYFSTQEDAQLFIDKHNV